MSREFWKSVYGAVYWIWYSQFLVLRCLCSRNGRIFLWVLIEQVNKDLPETPLSAKQLLAVYLIIVVMCYIALGFALIYAIRAFI